ncbi:Sua5/YciO/YrdC/YwlC family protein [Streptomyces sp. NBC_01003]|uniref:Sua5/YciO/YrdC/YwlC family protein n=1 Tax=Streptomyces sp. NBC_01003 TaxID=2903714 RepID=UPI00386454F9|nr:Sua5/YciO/YrdC/YwlC family protein [Streptomyces sp. NBC_01003]
MTTGNTSHIGEQALRQEVAAIGGVKIGAVKGLGGCQLVCDAPTAAAVGELRRDKARTAQTFAVMVRNLAAVERLGADQPYRTARAHVAGTARRPVHGPSAGWRAGSRPAGLAAWSRRPSHPCGRSCVRGRPPRDERNAVTAPGPFGPGRKAPAHGPSEDEF